MPSRRCSFERVLPYFGVEEKPAPSSSFGCGAAHNRNEHEQAGYCSKCNEIRQAFIFFKKKNVMLSLLFNGKNSTGHNVMFSRTPRRMQEVSGDLKFEVSPPPCPSPLTSPVRPPIGCPDAVPIQCDCVACTAFSQQNPPLPFLSLLQDAQNQSMDPEQRTGSLKVSARGAQNDHWSFPLNNLEAGFRKDTTWPIESLPFHQNEHDVSFLVRGILVRWVVQEPLEDVSPLDPVAFGPPHQKQTTNLQTTK